MPSSDPQLSILSYLNSGPKQTQMIHKTRVTVNDNQLNGEIDESVVSVNSSRAFSYALTPMGILVNAMPVAIVQCRASMEYSSTRSSTVL